MRKAFTLMSMVVGDEIAEKIADDGLEMIRTRIHGHFSNLSITEDACNDIAEADAAVCFGDKNKVLNPAIRRKKMYW
jgi:hypothetical protein